MSEFSFIEGIIDGQKHNGHGHGHVQTQPTGNEGQHASNTAVYNAGIKLSDVFQGFKLTPNGITALFFVGFGAWLFVLYFIRHNEPLANQVLGTPNAGAPTSHADRIIVSGAKNALPIAAPGGFYNGDNKQVSESLPQNGDASHFSQQSQMAFGGSPTSAPPNPDPSAAYGLAPGSHARVVQYGRERIVVGHPEPLPDHMNQSGSAPVQQHASPYGRPVQQAPYAAPSLPYTAAPVQTVPLQAASQFTPTAGFAHHQLPHTIDGGTSTNYNMPVQTHKCLRLRTVVNR